MVEDFIELNRSVSHRCCLLHIYLNIPVPFPQSSPRVCPPFLSPSEGPRCLQRIWVIAQLPGGTMENIWVREHQRERKPSRSQAKLVAVDLRHREAQMMVACRSGRAWGGGERWSSRRLRRKGWSCTGPTGDSATSHTERGSAEKRPAHEQKRRLEMFAESAERGK